MKEIICLQGLLQKRSLTFEAAEKFWQMISQLISTCSKLHIQHWVNEMLHPLFTTTVMELKPMTAGARMRQTTALCHLHNSK